MESTSDHVIEEKKSYLKRIAQGVIAHTGKFIKHGRLITINKQAHDILSGKHINYDIRMFIAYCANESIESINKEIADLISEKININTVKMLHSVYKLTGINPYLYFLDLMLNKKPDSIEREHLEKVVTNGVDAVVDDIVDLILSYDKVKVTEHFKKFFGVKGELDELLEMCRKEDAEYVQIIFDYFYEKPEPPDVPFI